jgi:hypothetical protein
MKTNDNDDDNGGDSATAAIIMTTATRTMTMNLQVVASVAADVGVFARAVKLAAVRPPLVLLIDVALVHADWLAGRRVSVGDSHAQGTWITHKHNLIKCTYFYV